MNIEAAQPGILFLLDHQRIRFGVGILPHSGHLPGHLDVGCARPDLELIVFDLAGNDGLGELPDHRQLVAEVSVERLKPLRQLNGRMALTIGGDVPVVDVLHLGRFDRGVNEIFVGRIQGMIDLEVLRPGSDFAGNVNVAVENSGIAAACVCVYSISFTRSSNRAASKGTSSSVIPRADRARNAAIAYDARAPTGWLGRVTIASCAIDSVRTVQTRTYRGRVTRKTAGRTGSDGLIPVHGQDSRHSHVPAAVLPIDGDVAGTVDGGQFAVVVAEVNGCAHATVDIGSAS